MTDSNTITGGFINVLMVARQIVTKIGVMLNSISAILNPRRIFAPSLQRDFREFSKLNSKMNAELTSQTLEYVFFPLQDSPPYLSA